MVLKFNDQGLSSQTDKYDDAVARYAEDADKLGTYPPTIMVGLGGTGAKALQHVRRLTLERFGAVDALEGVAYLSLDTDVASRRPSAEHVGNDPFTREIAFKDKERLDCHANFRDYLGPNMINHPHIREWWDPTLSISDDFNLEQGAGQIRPLSRLVFTANRQKIVDKLDAALNEVKSQANQSPRIDQGQKTRVVIVAGLAGGTGSGMFLDFAALVRQVIRGANIEGMLVLPGVYKGAEGVFPKIAANGYAALRELNHYMRHPFKVRWGARERAVEERGLYDRVVLFSGTNHANQQLSDTSDCYELIGEQLFIDFSEGGMARWVQGVRINRAQYLMRSVDREYRIQMPDGTVVTSHADSWKTCFQTFGISKVSFPSWRLLSYAAYDLAANMVSLMDPGRGGAISESLTELRDDFAYQSGFFQGERKDDEGGRFSSLLIIDALKAMRGTRTGANTFHDHIDILAQEMVDEAEVYYENGSTREDMAARFRELQSLLGDPFSAAGGGDWATLIQENRKLLLREVKEKIDATVEEFRNKPQVGPSGVAQLIDELIETVGKPADRSQYTEWFRQKQAEKAQWRQTSLANWNRQVDYAVEAHTGFFKSAGNHREAVKMACEAFSEYWQASVEEYICEEAVSALEQIRRMLLEQKDRLLSVCDSMFELRSVFESYRDFFEKPQRATAIQELDVPSHLRGQLLNYYLGWSDEEKEERLGALLNRGLREIRINTLRQLEETLRKRSDEFRAKLFKICFLALKGENGRTMAFRRDEGEDYEKEGFIQRYSALKMLAEQAGDDKGFREIVDRLYEQGLPWIYPESMTGMGLSDGDIPKDCFVGFNDAGEERNGQRLMEVLEGRAGEGFAARRVQVNDPSEIIFYTESCAFPAAYVGELYDDNGLQRYYEDNLRAGTALHLHQDYHQFQDLLPLKDGEVRQLKQAWKVFVLGLMVGRIRADLRNPDDETRFTYVYQRKVSAFEQRWESLGPQMAVISRLMNDSQLLQTLSRDVESARSEVETRGGFGQLAALSDYYFHCVFPVKKEASVAAGGGEVVGSAENEAVAEIRAELKSRARKQNNLDDDTLAGLIFESIKNLEQWARPSARVEGKPSPATEDLNAEAREFEWGLLEEARAHLPRLFGYVPARNALGEQLVAFPRLRIELDALPKREPEAAPPPLTTDDDITYHYAGPDGKAQDLSAADVVERVQTAPSATHKVWHKGMDGWALAAQVAPIAKLLAAAPPLLDAVTYHYAVGKERQGTLTAEAVAAAMGANPSLDHRVWQKGWSDWLAASEVDAIAAYLPPEDQPPPLEDEPPPLGSPPEDEPPAL